MVSKSKTTKHMFIPDPQVEEGVNTDHIVAAGHYAVDQLPDVIIIIGDWWNMGSLSSYEKPGSKYFHGRSYQADIKAGNDALDLFMAPIVAEQEKRRRLKYKRWNPRIVFCTGNHEYRIERAINKDPVTLEGTISYDDFNLSDYDIEVYDFLEIIDIDGILYSHYFVNQKSLTKGVLSGTIDNKLSKVMRSFSMGHQQVRQFGSSHNQLGNEMIGLVAGAFYSHDEDYMGPQGNHYWRGVVIKHEVENGQYDPMFVSIGYLLSRWYPGDKYKGLSPNEALSKAKEDV